MHMYKRKLFEHPIPSFFFYLIISEIVFDGFGKYSAMTHRLRQDNDHDTENITNQKTNKHLSTFLLFSTTTGHLAFFDNYSWTIKVL